MYGMGGMGMYGMGGMYGGGMGMGMGMGSAMMGPLMSLNQFLFGIQSVVFSLGQAVQIVGMNAQQIRHVYEGMRGMIESVLGHLNDKLGLAVGISSFDDVIECAKGGGVGGGGPVGGAMRWLSVSGVDEEHHIHDDESSSRAGGGEDRANHVPTHADIVRRRRLAAFRWTISLTASYFLYRAARRLIRGLIHGSDAGGRIGGGGNDYMHHHPQSNNGYHGDMGRGGGSNNQYYFGSDGMMRGGYGHGSNRYNSGHGQRGYSHDQYYSQGYGDMNGGYY
jgi:hypothetical protein